MFDKFLAILLVCAYIYICFKGLDMIFQEKSCKKYYLKNRMNCKCFTCRFHKKCTNSEFKNLILKVRKGDNNGMDI